MISPFKILLHCYYVREKYSSYDVVFWNIYTCFCGSQRVEFHAYSSKATRSKSERVIIRFKAESCRQTHNVSHHCFPNETTRIMGPPRLFVTKSSRRKTKNPTLKLTIWRPTKKPFASFSYEFFLYCTPKRYLSSSTPNEKSKKKQKKKRKKK